MSSSLGMRTLRTQQVVLAARHATSATSASGPARLLTTTTCSSRSWSSPSPHTQQRRFASGQSGTSAQQQQQRRGPSSAETSIAPAREPTATIPSAEALLNPPATTRPPPLDVPARDPQKSLPSYLFSVGKTYITFYKTALRNILTNRKLLSASSAAAPPKLAASTFPSRADVLLQSRTRHDIARLPVFGLIILVCGEFTPLVVVLFPRLTPYTCRIPKQIEQLRRAAETRREASFRNLRAAAPPRQLAGAEKVENDSSLARLTPGHIARTLGLTSRLWDRIGMDSPFSAAASQRAVARIAADDRLIKRDGGVAGLVEDEVVLACEDRGMNVRGQAARDLRRRLDEWVRSTTRGIGGGASAGKEGGERDAAAGEEAVRKLLLSEEVIIGKKSGADAAEK